MKTLLFSMLVSLALAANAEHHISKSGANAKAYIISPTDGAFVSQEFIVVFGLSNMGVAPAGTDKKYTGHHHLLVDLDTLPDLSKTLPANENIKHFGSGQTETVITLPPGKHTLQLLLGNYLHIPHDKPVVSEKITVIVK